jgi:16S rRNA (adenine1518-N6/adenine1519-N6)-dimethyltransferase
VPTLLLLKYDTDLANQLPKRPTAQNLTVIQHDILSFNLTTLPKNYSIVANIPYYLTSKLVRIVCESTNPPKKTVLLVQKEVAQRIAAQPGAMSILSVSAQVYNTVTLGIEVPAELFTPPTQSRFAGRHFRASGSAIGTHRLFG